MPLFALLALGDGRRGGIKSMKGKEILGLQQKAIDPFIYTTNRRGGDEGCGNLSFLVTKEDRHRQRDPIIQLPPEPVTPLSITTLTHIEFTPL